jgi:hypothetical protein
MAAPLKSITREKEILSNYSLRINQDLSEYLAVFFRLSVGFVSGAFRLSASADSAGTKNPQNVSADFLFSG